MKKVVVAMSGGVDSAVAAALLTAEGYTAIGITMQIWPPDNRKRGNRFGGCCGIDAVEDARKVAYKLGIPHYVMNFRDIFTREVIDDFCQEYSRGRTPNPCIRCNQRIKFGPLQEKARELNADFIATGHYAKIEIDESKGIPVLKKGFDRKKDQSYVLYPIAREQLASTLFPTGHYTKEKIREIATDMGLPVANKPDSQDICFIEDNNYHKFLEEYAPEAVKAGPVIDESGNILGRHRGIMFYTIGQRRGLGIANITPLYVTAIDPKKNTIVVGDKEQVYGSGLIASSLNWLTINELKAPITVSARIRYQHHEAEALVSPLGEDRVYVKFTEPQMAITPGQAIVFYDGDTVIGGSIIEQKKDNGSEVAECQSCLN